MSKILTRRNFLQVSGLALGTAMLAACGGDPAPTAAPAGAPVNLEISSSAAAGEFKYDKNELVANAGGKVTLKFNNKTEAAGGVNHNWVLVKAGKGETVVNNGTAAGEANGWLKPNDPDVIAHTKLIKGGESDTIEFTAPAKGTYDFECTFPGHSAGGMKGKFVVN